MSIDLVDLVKVIEYSRGVSEKAGIQLDTEIVSAQYNQYRRDLDRPYSYEFRDLQIALESLIQNNQLNGSVTRVSGVIAKVIIF